MPWEDVESLFTDNNPQNSNAANAGDGPKHIAWLHLLARLRDRVSVALETHSGGGVYEVEDNRFCIGLPVESILGVHQRWATANLPLAAHGSAYYSGSGGQALANLGPGNKYVAYDREDATRRRVAALAALWNKEEKLDSRHGSYAGNGDPTTGAKAWLKGCDSSKALVMIDPFQNDLERAAKVPLRRGNPPVSHPCVIFGVRSVHDERGGREFEQVWDGVLAGYRPFHRIEWRWSGDKRPGVRDDYLFALLVALPDEQDAAYMAEQLRREHVLLAEHRGTTHRYAASKPPTRLP